MIPVKDKYDEVFEVEIEGWCYGLANYPGEISSGLVHRVLKEVGPAFAEALKFHFAFNVLEIARRFSKAAKYLVPEREIAFSILSTFPHPSSLDEDGQYVIATVIDQVEQAYGNALAPLQKRWSAERKAANKATGTERRAA
jgi:hypothetical protein